MEKNTTKKKEILLALGAAHTSDLISALKECGKDASYMVKLVIDEEDDDSAYNDLVKECNKLYRLLGNAQRCVEIVADDEKKSGGTGIYYDPRGGNIGARGLLEDIDKALDSHYQTMVDIDLRR